MCLVCCLFFSSTPHPPTNSKKFDLKKKTECQCDYHTSCSTVRTNYGQSIPLENRERDGRCQCSCPVAILEAYAGRCPNPKQKINRETCNCECPSFNKLLQKCESEGKEVDLDNCACLSCPNCPGNTERQDERNCQSSCTCLEQSTSVYTKLMDRRSQEEFYGRLDAGYFEPASVQCDWRCSATSEDNCWQKRRKQLPFPDCTCARPSPPLPSSFRGGGRSQSNEKCSYAGDYSSSFGSKNCGDKSVCLSNCRDKARNLCVFNKGICVSKKRL